MRGEDEQDADAAPAVEHVDAVALAGVRLGGGCHATSSCAGCLCPMGLTTAGTPTAMELSGTSRMTTAFAPITTLSPMRIGPSSLAPVPMSTLLPITGAHGSSTRLRPTTTPLRMRQLSPNFA